MRDAVLDHPQARRSRFARCRRTAKRPTRRAVTTKARPTARGPASFYYNAYDLPARFTWGFETLYLHEAIPGHHFQISLAQENAQLPNFMRFGGNNAFVEGWALYSETLVSRRSGMETDPYQRFGGLNDEMLRAMRLVVDSGLHAKGWTRDQAIKYMRDNSSMSLTDATAEVERYIAIPGQALGYKIGQLTFLRLKAKAQAALGPIASISRKFHAQCLMTGCAAAADPREKDRSVDRGRRAIVDSPPRRRKTT